MKIIQVEQVTYEKNIEKAGKVYTDGEQYVFHTVDGTAWDLGQGAGEKMVEMSETIDSLSTAAARLQEDLGAVKGRLITAQKRRDVAEKTVETLRETKDQATQAHQGTVELLNRTKMELRTTTETLGRAQHTIEELEEAPHVTPVSPANLAMLKEKYNVDDLLRLRAGGLV